MPSHLTVFYACLALGGALGAVFNGLVAPIAFDRLTEYPVALVLACLVIPGWRVPLRSRRLDVAVPLVVGGVVVAAAYAFGVSDGLRLAVAGGVLLLAAWPLRFAGAFAAVLLALALPSLTGGDTIHRDRSFFGARFVEDKGDMRRLLHGTTLHGAQSRDPELRLTPLTYYHPTGPLGQLVRGLPRAARRWSAWASAPRPACSAGRPLDVLRDRPRGGEPRARLRPVHVPARLPGPARLRARRRSPDARAPPRRRVQPDRARRVQLRRDPRAPAHARGRRAATCAGSLREACSRFHISNRYLDLEPVLGNVAAELRLACRSQVDVEVTDETPGKRASHWMVLTRRTEDLGEEADWPWLPCDSQRRPRVDRRLLERSRSPDPKAVTTRRATGSIG